jgi:hypothetical protein
MEITDMARAVYARKNQEVPTPPIQQKEAALARWESVKEEKKHWLKPFHELPIERAMAYLEDLRKICEDAGHIMNERINHSDSPIKCSGPHCGVDLTGVRPNGRPKWMGQKVLPDKNNPEIKHILYFCSDTCDNAFSRASQGSLGTTGQ